MTILRTLPVRAAALALLTGSLTLGAVASPVRAAPYHASVRPLTIADGIVSGSFNPFAPTPLDGTRAGIYEPLYIVSYVNNSTVTPWLATAYTYSKDLKTLTFTIRQGVHWSDGQPLTARDVYYTLTAGKTQVAMNQGGLWGPNGLATSVTQSGQRVTIHFKQPEATGFATLVNNVMIVPAHIWSTIKNPSAYPNAHPVGSGPFTEVRNYSPEHGYDIGKNTHYWQAGKPQFDTLRFSQFTGNIPIALALAAGQVDWFGGFIPNVQKDYVAHNPQYFHHFVTSHSLPNLLYFNTTAYPYSLPVFRKALSMAMNRQAYDTNAEYGNAPPSDSTGLSGQYPTWRDKSLPNTLTQYNPAAARAMLLKAGFTMRGGSLVDPKGHPVSFNLPVVAGFTDFVAINQIMAHDFNALGIQASVTPVAQFGDWYSKVQQGGYNVVLGFASGGATPYDFYYNLLDSENYQPIGTAVTVGNNYARYHNPTVDRLLARFRATTDATQQHAIVDQLQRIFITDLPDVPVLIQGIQEDYDTQYYTGFPDARNLYASPAFGANPTDRLLTLVTIKPR